MKTISLASIALDFIPEDQLGFTAISQKAISRAVFDDLLERDIVGFLLSSEHLRKYLAHFATYAEPTIAKTIKRNICSVDIIDQFHEQTLEMFAGAYIPESKCATLKDLMHALNVKYEAYAKELHSCNVHYEASLQQLTSVELAWQYRHACTAGGPLISF